MASDGVGVWAMVSRDQEAAGNGGDGCNGGGAGAGGMYLIRKMHGLIVDIMEKVDLKKLELLGGKTIIDMI